MCCKGRVNLSLISLSAVLVFAGCGAQMQKPIKICPGKKSVADSLGFLITHSQNIPPLRATGQCRLNYYIDGRKSQENFPVKLWLNPPFEMYMQGDIAFDARAIVLGSNQNEFWLTARPKEISGYWYGSWSERSRPGKMMLSPKVLLEALGIVGFSGSENIYLSDEGAYDVITKQNPPGLINKKLYINKCDYRLAKIEYFDTTGK
jgi:hypothetical protein